MCLSKADAKRRLVVWAEWMNNNEGFAGAGHCLGFSSDGKMDPDYVATAGCRGSGVKVDATAVVRPDYVEQVALALSGLDEIYQAYAFVFFRWKMRNKATISECIEKFCNEGRKINASMFKRISQGFYDKVCALLGR